VLSKYCKWIAYSISTISFVCHYYDWVVIELKTIIVEFEFLISIGFEFSLFHNSFVEFGRVYI